MLDSGTIKRLFLISTEHILYKRVYESSSKKPTTGYSQHPTWKIKQITGPNKLRKKTLIGINQQITCSHVTLL